MKVYLTCGCMLYGHVLLLRMRKYSANCMAATSMVLFSPPYEHTADSSGAAIQVSIAYYRNIAPAWMIPNYKSNGTMDLTWFVVTIVTSTSVKVIMIAIGKILRIQSHYQRSHCHDRTCAVMVYITLRTPYLFRQIKMKVTIICAYDV